MVEIPVKEKLTAAKTATLPTPPFKSILWCSCYIRCVACKPPDSHAVHNTEHNTGNTDTSFHNTDTTEHSTDKTKQCTISAQYLPNIDSQAMRSQALRSEMCSIEFIRPRWRHEAVVCLENNEEKACL